MTQITREEAIQILVTALLSPPEQKPEPEKSESYPEMVSIKEASKRTGISYDSIRKLCVNNKIAHFRAGKRWLVNWEKFVEFLDGETASGQGGGD